MLQNFISLGFPGSGEYLVPHLKIKAQYEEDEEEYGLDYDGEANDYVGKAFTASDPE